MVWIFVAIMVAGWVTALVQVYYYLGKERQRREDLEDYVVRITAKRYTRDYECVVNEDDIFYDTNQSRNLSKTSTSKDILDLVSDFNAFPIDFPEQIHPGGLVFKTVDEITNPAPDKHSPRGDVYRMLTVASALYQMPIPERSVVIDARTVSIYLCALRARVLANYRIMEDKPELTHLYRSDYALDETEFKETTSFIITLAPKLARIVTNFERRYRNTPTVAYIANRALKLKIIPARLSSDYIFFCVQAALTLYSRVTGEPVNHLALIIHPVVIAALQKTMGTQEEPAPVKKPSHLTVV